MLTALSVANSFLEQSFKENVNLTPMKLQKLIYILYKAYLKETKDKLFNEKFEVWKYGPVLPSVFQTFNEFKSNPINKYYSEDGKTYSTVKKGNAVFDRIFEDVWNKYKSYDGIFLSTLTHLDDTAWSVAKINGDMYINDEYIYKEVDYDEYL